MSATRVVGIDYGEIRVGLAIADPLGLFAQPIGTFSPGDAIANLVTLHQTEGIRTIVIGWPLLPDGTEGGATESVDRFVRRVLKRVGSIDIIRWDERNTSEEARDRILSGPNPSMRKAGRGRVDTVAAGIILEEYLTETR